MKRPEPRRDGFLDAEAVQDLMARAKDPARAVAPRELAAVAEALRAPGPDAARAYELLYVLGRAYAFEHEALIASFLESPQDPVLARLALQILCTFWDRTASYLHQVRRFVERLEWDEFGDVRSMAFTVAGRHLRENVDCSLFGYLVLASGEGDDGAGFDALRAIGVALGESDMLGASQGRLRRERERLLAEADRWMESRCRRRRSDRPGRSRQKDTK